MDRTMFAFVTWLLLLVRCRFKSRARLEAETLVAAENLIREKD